MNDVKNVDGDLTPQKNAAQARKQSDVSGLLKDDGKEIFALVAADVPPSEGDPEAETNQTADIENIEDVVTHETLLAIEMDDL